MIDAGTAAPRAPRSETAARRLVRRAPTALAGELSGTVLERLKGRAWDAVDTVWVVDPAGRLVGRVPLVRLLAAPPGAPVRDAMEGSAFPVGAETDQEEVAARSIRHGLDSVAVVDGKGVLLGVVPPRAMLAVLRREHVEDLHRLAGIAREAEQARHALEDPPLRRARHRLPWLLVGLLGAMGSARLAAGFEATLEARVALSFFIPAIVYLADAIGTQTEAITVRFLSLSRASFARLLLGEVRTGLLIAGVLAVAAMPLAALTVGDARVAAAVSISILVAGGLATMVGVLLPWLLGRMGLDPAFGSGPIATIVQDVLSLLVYLSLVSRIAT